MMQPMPYAYTQPGTSPTAFYHFPLELHLILSCTAGSAFCMPFALMSGRKELGRALHGLKLPLAVTKQSLIIRSGRVD